MRLCARSGCQLAVVLACFLVSVRVLPAQSEDVICLVAPGGQDHITTFDCGVVDSIWWDSEGVGYSTEGDPCRTGSCDCIHDRPCFEWSVSSSETDSEASVGALPLGEVDFFLWLQCSNVGPSYGFRGIGGVAAVVMDIQVNGVEYVSFTPMNGALNAGTKSSLLLAIGGCPGNGLVIGRIETLNDPTSLDLSTWGRVKSLYR